MKTGKKEKIATFGSLFSFIAFALLLRQSGISVDSVVNVQNSFMQTFLAGGGNFSAVLSVFGPFIAAILSLVFLVLSLAFLSSYGYYEPNKKLGMTVGVIEAAVFILIFQSVVSIFIALSAFLSATYIVLLSNTYGKELKRWINFRVGSNSVGKVFLIFNVLLALGILLAVSTNTGFYQESFRAELKDVLLEAVGSNLGEFDPRFSQANIEEQIDQQVENALDSSPLFASYFRWLPVISALGVWIILEFFRNLILSNIGGIFTSILIKFNKKLE